MSPDTVGITARTGGNGSGRLRAVAASTVFSVGFALVCSRWPGSDGRTAVALDLVNVIFFGAYAVWSADRAIRAVILAALAFGVVELGADFLCVRGTGTLDYAAARSAMVLESPWWMPLSWAVVAVQTAVPGEAAIRRFGVARGMLLTGLFGATLIPGYEEMAWGANWWRYRDCLMVGHTPVYIVLSEGLIGAGLALMGRFTLRSCSPPRAILLGAGAGLMTIPGGVLGWGLVEFIGRGARPTWWPG